MALKLYINERPIELADKSKIGLTFQVNNLNNLQNRQGYFSNEFSAPKTRANEDALGFSSDINSSSIIPYRNNVAKVVQDGVEIIPDGIAIVHSFDGFYKIIVYSGNVDLFDAIGDGTLPQLYWGDCVHQWQYADILASANNINTFIYPLVDFGDTAQSIPFGLNIYSVLMYPMLFCKGILDKILEPTGYIASGTMYNSTQLSNMLLSVTKWVKNSDFMELHTVHATVVPNNPLFYFIMSPMGAGSNNIQTFNFITNITSGTEMITGAAIYTPTVDIWGTLEITGSILFGKNCLYFDSCDYIVDIVDLSTSTIIATNSWETIDLFPTGSTTKNFNVGVYYHFQAMHSYQARLTLRSNLPTANNDKLEVTIIEGTNYSFLPSDTLIVGDVVNVNDLVPAIKNRDFIKAICNMTSTVFTTNIITKEISFNFLDDILLNIPRAKDWSSKIDVRGISIQFHNDSYAQSNNFRYKEDETVLKYYGDGVITIDDETLDLTTDLVQLPFAATENYVNLNSYYVPRIKFKTNATSYRNIEPRVLMLDRVALSPVRLYDSYNLSNNSTYTQAPFAYFINPNKFDSIGFDENLLTNYYKTIASIFTQYKEISVNFKLTAVDISELDFLIPIYLDVHVNDIQLNGYFYLNKVENYKGGELTKCKLIRI
ncbi:hypothetical protein UFOVP606_4 [uncultured Caudovirales phage]|uniref:Uncharacterized protein n=1 Tax=uncultured Caudovirales phage TaxID=2100421 RepID=A0A6J5N4T9_9CAUD|nr:hypothetical protein UFOVP606_4 [uncultured Caudovirales phage]